MIYNRLQIITFLLLLLANTIYVQSSIYNVKWDDLIYSQSEEWYASKEAVGIADNVLLYQRDVGGWPKNVEMHQPLSEAEKTKLRKLKTSNTGATIDNDATTQELDFLSKIYAQTHQNQYKTAFLKGINYLFEAQYENSGWPQFYPLEEGDYSTHITYNDNAMVNVMKVMKAIFKKSDRFSIPFDEETVRRAKISFDKGVEIILKTQYQQNGILTVWCAQHDEKTLLPAKARSYELPSLSGSESVDIVLLLMQIENPSPEIINAIQAAVVWFDKVKITGIRVEEFINSDGLKDVRVIEDKNAPALWARFYELEDNRPFFCDRDGIKKYSLAEIGPERREGYSWYTDGPKDIFKKYEKWQPRLAPNKNVIEDK